MTDSHGIARDQLKAIVERVERLELEIKDLNDDKSEIYKEARANGFDVKAIKKVVQKRKLDEHVRVEADIVFDTYWDAVHGVNIVHAHARENIEEFDAGSRSSSPLYMRPETVSELPETANKSTAARKDVPSETFEDGRHLICNEKCQDKREEASHRQAGTQDLPVDTHSPSDDDAIAAVNLNEGLANVADVEPSSSAPVAPASQGEAEAPSEEVSPSIIDQPRRLTGDAEASDANTGGLNEVDAHEDAATHQSGSRLVSDRLPAAPGTFVTEMDPPFPMKRAEFAHCFPELSRAGYEELEDSIQVIGVQEPIVRKGDVILDGFNRYNIARSFGEEYPVIEYDGTDELIDVIRWQRSSRDWTPAQEAKIAKDLSKEYPHRSEEIWAAFHIAELPDGEVVAR